MTRILRFPYVLRAYLVEERVAFTSVITGSKSNHPQNVMTLLPAFLHSQE